MPVLSPNSLPAYLNSLPTTLTWPLENSKGWEHLPELVHAFAAGNLIGVTDGSYKNERGTATWIVCDETRPSI